MNVSSPVARCLALLLLASAGLSSGLQAQPGEAFPPDAKPGECWIDVSMSENPDPASESAAPADEDFELIEEKVIDRPGTVEWRKCRGPIERVDPETGDILCLVTVGETYRMVTRRVPKAAADADGEAEPVEAVRDWRQMVCQEDIDEALIRSVQRALKEAGYKPGRIDGKIKPVMVEALQKFQKTEGLLERGLTFETLAALGIDPPD